MMRAIFGAPAADVAHNRPHRPHSANPDETAYACTRYAMSFTKGLEHDKKPLDENTLLVENVNDMAASVKPSTMATWMHSTLLLALEAHPRTPSLFGSGRRRPPASCTTCRDPTRRQ